MSLKEIGKSMYGTKYAYSGAIPLSFPELSELKFGDVIRDNGGTGAFFYVITCYKCEGNFLAGMLILEPTKCSDCVDEYFAGLKRNCDD